MKQWRWILGGILGICVVLIGFTLVIPLLADFSWTGASLAVTAVPLSNSLDQTNLENGMLYIVRPGDTLFAISRRFGVALQTIVLVNQIADPRLIHVGQSLVIPSNTAVQLPASPVISDTTSPVQLTPSVVVTTTDVSLPQPVPETGTIYYVRWGDSLYLIARRFRTTVNALVAANNISNPSLIYSGQQLLIPSGSNPVVQALTGPTAVPSANQPQPTLDPPPTTTPVSSEYGLIWPNDYRRLYQRFRYGHGAIDIAMPVGTAVLAAAAGTIEFAGWHSAGFGYLVIIDHDNGMRTLYAHNSELLVTTGQQVAQGEQIARSGSTGNSSHPHLHFSITENGRLIDPCTRLLPGC